MEKVIIRCPRCGGQKFHIGVEYKYKQFYIVDNNKLYKKDDGMSISTGDIWLTCEDCLQNEMILDAEWKASLEEVRIINDMLMGSEFSMDVTEYMEGR